MTTKNNLQNGHLHPSLPTEGDRSNIANWRLSGRDDEEVIEGVSFPVYRRVSTMILVPGQNASSVEMVAFDPQELQASQKRDKAMVSFRNQSP